MNDSETYIANQIRLSVWSGLTSPEDVQNEVSDILEADADETMLRGFVVEEFARKAEEEASWPAVTDCDKLDASFRSLTENGVVAIHNAGWDKSEAFNACLDAYARADSPPELFGICYYTTQDIESAIDGDGLFIGFSSTRPENEATDSIKTATLICKELEAVGLSAKWDNDPVSRIVVDLKWQKRN